MLYVTLRVMCYLFTFQQIANTLAEVVEEQGIAEPISKEQAKAAANALRRLDIW